MRRRGLVMMVTAVAVVVAAGALVAGPAWASMSADPSPDNPPGNEQMMPGDEDMDRMHERMLREYPGMREMHEGMPEQMTADDCPMHG